MGGSFHTPLTPYAGLLTVINAATARKSASTASPRKEDGGEDLTVPRMIGTEGLKTGDEKKPKKAKQQKVEGGEAEPKEIPCEEGEGILLSLKVVDVATHQKKGGYYTIPMFAQIGSGSSRLMTANINISNLKKEGMEFLTKALGAKPTMKTPIIAKILIPKGALLDHWMENHPSEEDTKAVEKENKGAGEQ